MEERGWKILNGASTMAINSHDAVVLNRLNGWKVLNDLNYHFPLRCQSRWSYLAIPGIEATQMQTSETDRSRAESAKETR
jgi:hypothetical protein